MKKHLSLLIIAIFMFSAIRVVPAQAACPTTTSGNDTRTNPASGGCLTTDTWDGQGGDDTLTNDGTITNFYGGTGNNTLTNTSNGDVTGTIRGSDTSGGSGSTIINNYGTAGYVLGIVNGGGNGTVNNYGTVNTGITGIQFTTGDGVVNNYGTVIGFVLGNNGGIGSTGNGTATNFASGTVDSLYGSETNTGDGTAINYGTVTTTIVGGSSNSGDGTVYNYGTANGTIYGGSQNSGNGTVYNYGTANGTIYGSEFAFGKGTVYNYGIANDINGGHYNFGDATVNNYGTVNGGIIGTVDSFSGNGFVNNSNTVTGDIIGIGHNNAGYSGNGTVNNSGTVGGGITGNSNTNGNSTVNNSGIVVGNIVGNDSNSIGNSTVNIVGSAFVGGYIQSGSGDDFVNIDVNSTVMGIINGQAGTDKLTFDGTTNSEGDYGTFLAELATKNPSGGTITFQGRTYTWTNFEGLQELVKLLLNITWFSPNDGRLDPHPAERIALYCHADKNTLGVLLIDGNSQGNVGVSFKIDALNALGSKGTTYDFGANGVLSISLGADGQGYAAWNGGSAGANGQGDFAKSFSCTK